MKTSRTRFPFFRGLGKFRRPGLKLSDRDAEEVAALARKTGHDAEWILSNSIVLFRLVHDSMPPDEHADSGSPGDMIYRLAQRLMPRAEELVEMAKESDDEGADTDADPALLY